MAQLSKEMVQAVAREIGATAVIVLAFGPPRPGQRADGMAVWSESWGTGEAVASQAEAVELELLDDIEHEFMDTEDLAAAIRAQAGKG